MNNEENKLNENNVSITYQIDFTNKDKLGFKNPIKESKINWSKYNWPLCLKLVHFDLEEIHEKIRYVFTILYINFFLGAILFFTKFFVQIFIRNNNFFIIIAFGLYLVVVFTRFIVLFSAYRGLFLEDDYKIVYKVFSIIFIIFAILNAIIGEFIFDGIFRIIYYTQQADTQASSVSLILLLYFEYILNCIFLILEIIAFIGFFVIERKYDN